MGLALFKFGAVFVVTAVCLYIARYRPRTSGLLLCFGCTVLSLVVAYSSCLVWLTEVVIARGGGPVLRLLASL